MPLSEAQAGILLLLAALRVCHHWGEIMKDPYEILNQKYVEVARLRKETEALRLVIGLIEDDSADLDTRSEVQSLSLCTGTEDK